ncbi:MAG: YbjN domain-containing protein [Pseudomonadota bacterium]
MTRSLFAFLSIAVMAFISAPAAKAQDLVDGSNVNAIMDIARGYGSASLSKQKNGNPLINGRINGIKYGIYFYSCKEGANCTAMQFYAGWKVGDAAEDAKVTKLNEWNRTKRWGRAYLDRVGDIAVEYDINLAFGVTRANLDDSFDYWRLISGEAQKFFRF